MVSRWIVPATALAVVTVVLVPLATADDSRETTEPELSVREALSARRYPWYDSEADGFRPVMPPAPPRQSTRAQGSDSGGLPRQDVGQLLIFVLLTMGLTVLVLLLARAWHRRRGGTPQEQGSKRVKVVGEAARTGALPSGLKGIDEADPREAAWALRERGERGRAVVMLFAHQLLMLDQLGLIRLAPGRTGRQLVRSIGDDVIREAVSQTLRLFEAFAYGHREPDSEAFEALWQEAEALDARLASGVSR